MIEGLTAAAALGDALAGAGLILAIAVVAVVIATRKEASASNADPRDPTGLPPGGAADGQRRKLRYALVAVAVTACFFVLGIELYWRSRPDPPKLAERVLGSLVALICAIGASERVLTLVRSRAEPTRRAFEWNHSWMIAIVVIASLIGFGVVGVFDMNRRNDVRAGVMLFAGLTVTALTVRWFRKPTHPEGRSRRVDPEHQPVPQHPSDPGGRSDTGDW